MRLRHRFGAALLGIVALLGALLLTTPPASAGVQTTYVIQTTADELNENGVMSLREAVALANTDGFLIGSTFDLVDDVTYQLTRCGNGEDDTNETGDLDMLTGEALDLFGEATIRQTCPGERVIETTSAIAQLEVSRTTITGGDATGDGGGLLVNGGLNINLGANLTGNHADGFGGGARVNGVSTIGQASITDNTSGSSGGGIFGVGDVGLSNATVSGNVASNQAGGISSNDDITIFGSTVTQNEAGDLGGGMRASASVTVNTGTVVANRAASAANIRANTLSHTSSIIALGSGGSDCNITGAITGFGENVGGDLSCGIPLTNDLLFVHPMLAPLVQDNPFTETRAAVPPSPAIDHDQAPCVGLDDDQNNVEREASGACNAGSVELDPVPTCSPTFPDVSGTHPFFDEICWLDQMGITGGFGDGTFKPAQAVSRQAMSAFIYRLALAPGFTPPATPTFTDVGTGHPFFQEIEWMADTGIAGGFPDETFKPLSPVSRQAMAAFLYRVDGEPLFIPVGQTFTDVSASHPFYDEIEWLADSEVAEGFPDGTFRPGTSVSRQAMAAFMLRVASAPQTNSLIDGL
jgi:hypothetical protein